jgi:EpsI family protein
MPERLTVFLRDTFSGRSFWVVTAVLLTAITAFYVTPTAEFVPNPPPLNVFATELGGWRMTGESPIDADTARLLRADDTLSRVYMSSSGALSLFVAFFKSQRAGVTPHSPKVCLPGSGWTPESASRIWVEIPGGMRLRINRFVVSRGDSRSIVYYWYQSAHREFSDEYVSKAYLILDGLRYRRSDEAIVRVVSPVVAGEAAAQDTAVRFIQAIYAPLKKQMWIDN